MRTEQLSLYLVLCIFPLNLEHNLEQVGLKLYQLSVLYYTL